MEEYRNILANKFMRDTNYIIIKDTDDLEELERQWELFQSSLTVRQQRLSDDRSLQIWNMTNQQHYEALKVELMGDLQNKLGIEDDEPTSIEYEPDNDEKIDDSEITNFVNMSFDDFEIPDDENEISEPMKEEAAIPIDPNQAYVDNHRWKIGYDGIDREKDKIADQYEIDSNINIIGGVYGETPKELLDNLEKAYQAWNSQNQDHRKKSDDKCREIYGMSNIDRYNKLKGIFVKLSVPKTEKDVSKTISNNTNSSEEALSEFTLEVYRNMQVVNEAESNKAKQHRRLNDTPYFTPSEMIDMGVHGNHNYYCKDADNDGLITRVRIPTWFDSYKDMCMDHIFEDYTRDWIDTLDYLYSDFEEIKESGNEEKILARKQSILDLGWNPEIPFTRRNRQLASKRVSKLLDKSSPMNLFINLDKEVPDEAITDEPVTENASKDTHQPIYMIFVQGKSPIVSTVIKKVTNSSFSHIGISFDSKLDTVHTYNMIPKAGVVKETLSNYKDNIITVMAFFAPTNIYNTMKDTVIDYYINAKKTVYDFGIIFNKLIDKNARVVNDKYHQVCSTFVDAVLKSGKVTLDKDANVPSPAELYNATKSMPNKIIEVYSGPADKYDSVKVDKKMNKLLEKGVASINETKLTDKIRNKRADMDLELTAKTYDALSHLTKDEKKKAEMKKKAISARSMKGLLDFDEESVNERYIFSEPDYQINIDKWGPGNPLWITGTSGDGKSTLCNKMAKERSNSLIVHTDTFLCRVSFTKEKYERKRASWVNNKTVGDEMSYEYIDLHPELEYDMKDKNKNFIDHDKFKKYFIDYAYWIMEQAETNPNYKNKNIIVEGCDICLLDPELMSTKPVIVIGGSRLRTAFRRVKRDIQTDDKSIIEAIFREIKREKSYVNRLNKDKETFLDNLRDLSVNEEDTITEGIHDIMNGTNPFSTKTFYHVSFDDNLDDEVLKPRIPSWITNEVKKNPNFIKELEKLKDSNSTSGTGFEEYMTPRVCFSPSIEGCLNAIINEKGRMHLHNETLYVYIPEKPINEYKTKTNRQILKDGDIFDANVTQEMWILEPVKLKYVGSIVVDKITGEHIKKFANNKNKTNIKYDYKWHWFHKVKYRYNPEKNKFVTEASISDSKRVAIDIRDKTIAYLKKIVESDEYQQKWGKFKFFKDNINIYPTEYGDYKASINICDCSPWSVNADEYYDNSKEKQLFHKWYYDLLNKGKNFINNKFSSTLDKYDIYVSLGDEDECTIYLESKLNEKHPILFKAKSILAKESASILNEAISDLDSAESNDIYHNIEDWESGKSNVLWVTGLSGSGKSTIAKEISVNNIEHVELDNLQRAKMDNWDHTDSTLMDDYIKSKGGLTNIFSYVNDLDKVRWKDIVSNETECPKQFNDFFEYIIKYANTHKNKRFVVEGVQIAMCSKNTTIAKISKYPVIIKMNGPLKTEFRREKRTIQTGIDKNDTFINILKSVANRHKNWWQQNFYMDDWKELNYFRTHIGESASILNEVKQFPVEFDQDGNLIIYKARIGSIAYGDEIDDSVKLLESYRNTNNIEGMKYELAKLWFINDSIEKKLKKKLTNDQYKELIDHRATCLNVFKLNLEYVMKAEKGFNFSDYYNSTPFSDNSVKITANTLKYSMKAIASMI